MNNADNNSDYGGKYAPTGNETGTDFRYKKLADSGCVRCGGQGEWHVPYDDWSTYIIHRCDCTRGNHQLALDIA